MGNWGGGRIGAKRVELRLSLRGFTRACPGLLLVVRALSACDVYLARLLALSQRWGWNRDSIGRLVSLMVVLRRGPLLINPDLLVSFVWALSALDHTAGVQLVRRRV